MSRVPVHLLLVDVVAEVHAFSGLRTFADDVCLVGAEVRRALPA